MIQIFVMASLLAASTPLLMGSQSNPLGAMPTLVIALSVFVLGLILACLAKGFAQFKKDSEELENIRRLTP